MHAQDFDTLRPSNATPAPALPSPSLHAPTGAEQGVATVLRIDPAGGSAGGWWLGQGVSESGESGARELLAKRAASCLIAPEIGDQVWMAGDQTHGVFVLAILVRRDAGSSPSTISVEGDLELRAEGGVVRVRGSEGLELGTPARLSLSAGELHAQASVARFTFGELAAVARRVYASLTRVTHVGKLLELLVDKVTQRSQHSVRAIAGVDHTQAGTISLEATHDAHIRAERALINGKDLVKMDGAQIHLG